MGMDDVVSQRMLAEDRDQAARSRDGVRRTREAVDVAPPIQEPRTVADDSGAGLGAAQDIVLHHIAALFCSRA